MIPSKKSKLIEGLLENVAGRSTSIEANKCVNPPFGCGLPIETFRDEISLKEYKISGLCQHCQDKVFGGEDA